ncbi:glycosyltransferase family 4 protein [bacterium]|nr:glycosyltransferase family 4 protein [bacterium]
MRITYIIAGSGRMECDTCLRDGLLARTMKAMGHDVLFVPMYTPLPAIVGEQAGRPLFYGGINVYLQQKFSLFRHTPRFFDRLLNSPKLIDWVSRFGHMTQPGDLAALTVSVMEGPTGNQKKELDALLEWLKGEPRPDAIILPTSLLAGLAVPLRKGLGAPVFCLLSGEDQFIEQFPEPHRTLAIETLRRCVRGIDGFMAASRYYAGFMTEYLGLAPGSVRIMTPGIDTESYKKTFTPPARFTIGYRSPVCAPNGLHVLAEALKILKANPETADCRVRAAGFLTAGDRPYLDRILKDIRHWGLQDSFEYAGELTPPQRVEFLNGLSVFTVPVIYPEPTGLYVPEAMAAGVPVVAPCTGCLPEWIDCTGGGILIDKSEPRDLAGGIARIMKDPRLAKQLGESGKKVIFDKFNLDAMAESILRTIRSLKK